MQRILVVMLCGIILAGCQDDADILLPQPEREVVATVGDKQLFEEDIKYEILSMPESMRHIMQDSLARAQVLDVMIKREAVAQKAKAMGLGLDPLVAYRIRQANNAVLIESIHAWQSQSLSPVTPEEVAIYYKEHLHDFMIPEQIHARHILLGSKQEAVKVLKLLQTNPHQFSALAAQFSIDDSNKSRGGDLNWFSRGAMAESFEKVAFALGEHGRLSMPIETDFGWHIIEWLGKRDASTLSLDEARGEIISVLRKKKLDAWISSVMEQASVEVLKEDYRLQSPEFRP